MNLNLSKASEDKTGTSPVLPTDNNDLPTDTEFFKYLDKAKIIIEREDRAAEQKKFEAEFRELLRIPLENQFFVELAELARLAPSTERVYLAEVRRFKEFADSAHMSACPAAPELVCHFILQQAEDGASVGTLQRQIAAIGWAHREKNFADVTDDILVRAVLRALMKPPTETLERTH